MKHKLLHFKSILCSLGILLLLIGCQNDEGNHTHNENLKVKKVSLTEIPIIKDVLELKSRTVVARSSDEINYFAYVNPENVYVYTDDEGLNTYTFSLSLAEPENQMSNLVIREMPDATFQYRLMRYESDDMATWKQDIAAGLKPTATVRISSEILEAPSQRGGGACDTFVTDFTCPSGMHSGWSRNECAYEFYTWSTKVTVMSSPCDHGGGPGGGQASGPIITVPNAPVNLLANFVSGLSDAQKDWWNNWQNAGAVSVIKNYLNSRAYMESSKIFSRWAIDYFRLHPNTTVAQFQNWFMTPNEGNDGDYDAAFWENPNLSFEHQDLPSWNDFDAAYPRNLDGTYMTGADNVYSHVGGAVWQARLQNPSRTANTCALKVSIALNYSGVNIPQIITTQNKPGTIQGADGKYYFLNARALNIWMRETFGVFPENPNHYNFTAGDGGINGENFPTLVAGIRGIYSLVTPNNPGVTGHADILNSSNCAAGCNFNIAIEYIDIWHLD